MHDAKIRCPAAHKSQTLNIFTLSISLILLLYGPFENLSELDLGPSALTKVGIMIVVRRATMECLNIAREPKIVAFSLSI